jgi:hypothetical protein
MEGNSATRSEAEVASILSEFERRRDVFRLTVDGISLWRLLRFEIALSLQNLGLTQHAIPRGKIIAGIFRATHQFIVASRGYSYLGATLISALRRRDERGWHDVYFDDVIDSIEGGAKMAYIDAVGFEDNARHAYRPPVFDDTSVLALSAVLGRIFRTSRGDAAFGSLSKFITGDLGLSEFTPERIRRKYDVFRWRARLYRQVLKRLQPGCVLVPNSGQFALFLAAKNLGIRFVEMQHGVFTENHPDSLPADVLDCDRESLLLPDCLTVYGSYWVDRLSGTALGKLGCIRAVGAPLIEPGRLLRQSKFLSDPTTPVLTLTTQGGVVGQKAFNFVSAFLKLCSGPLRLNIRLHPGYETGINTHSESVTTDARVTLWPGNSRPDTYEMIAMSDLHLSVSSACHFDALGIGAPTGILALPSHELVLDLARSGDALLIDSPETLAAVVKGRSWGTVQPATSDRYFRKDHIRNVREVLAEFGSPARRED